MLNSAHRLSAIIKDTIVQRSATPQVVPSEGKGKRAKKKSNAANDYVINATKASESGFFNSVKGIQFRRTCEGTQVNVSGSRLAPRHGNAKGDSAPKWRSYEFCCKTCALDGDPNPGGEGKHLPGNCVERHRTTKGCVSCAAAMFKADDVPHDPKDPPILPLCTTKRYEDQNGRTWSCWELHHSPDLVHGIPVCPATLYGEPTKDAANAEENRRQSNEAKALRIAATGGSLPGGVMRQPRSRMSGQFARKGEKGKGVHKGTTPTDETDIALPLVRVPVKLAVLTLPHHQLMPC